MPENVYLGARGGIADGFATVKTRSLDLAAQQRAGLVTWYLMCGYGLSTMDVAELTGTTRTGAYLMMKKLEAVLPLTVVGGRWRVVEGQGKA